MIQRPCYKWLVSEAAKKGINDPVTWNFTKFLVDEKGQLVTVFSAKDTTYERRGAEILKLIGFIPFIKNFPRSGKFYFL